MEVYNVIGIMSGTSLDGLDICYCNFKRNENREWSFQIISCSTVNYPSILENKLYTSKSLDGNNLMLLHNELGNFIGKSINSFITDYQIDKNKIDGIASHGHTVFHQPENHLTTQIGNGANISAITGLPVICDFRTTDMALLGQGAPLVPIGDDLLFTNFDSCINLGGIANISFNQNNKRIAFDICPVNIVLNKLANDLGQQYDNQGLIAKSGNINNDLLKKLNELSYYQEPPPKSLGIEWIEDNIFSLLNTHAISTKDILRTFVEHISILISKNINTNDKEVLISGGGVFNNFLIDRIQHHSKSKIIVPHKDIINYKEALIFAFLGVLRLKNEPNCLSSVTGATTNSIGGCIYKTL